MQPYVHCIIIHTATKWMPQKYPSIDKWIKMIKDVVHIYNKIVLSHKKERNLALCNKMERPIMVSKISQKNKNTV